MQKLAIVTGGNAGLGKQTALRLADAGFDLVLAGRDLQKCNVTAMQIKTRYPAVTVESRHLDLADLNSVSAFANQQNVEWNLLVNNAGAKIERPYKQTAQGHEWHVGVNHLGHFALTADLWPMANTDATVVSVSSIVARNGLLQFSAGEESFDERAQYANSKLMNLAFATALSQKLSQTKRSATVAHPGFARAQAYGNAGIRIAEHLLAQSAARGSEPIFEACFAKNGSYLAPRIFEIWSGSAPARTPTLSQTQLDDFWLQSEKLTGREFKPLG